MFGLFRTKRDQQPSIPPPTEHVRDTLFGDMPLDKWRGPDSSSPSLPWSHFRQARQYWREGDVNAAYSLFRQVLEAPGLEPRHYLQAWHFLRQMGHTPEPEVARQVLGAVVEVGFTGGTDLVAAYADGSARYYNFSGAGVIWEHPNASLDTQVQALLNAAARVAREAGPWEGPRPAPPAEDKVRVSALTPSGLIFGEGYLETMGSDPLGGPFLAAAQSLMEALIAVSRR
jgi:hypothetical protein